VTTTLLRASSVSRRFGDVLAVDDVSMHVQAGEVVGLLGANGAGKTTLIRMLLGLLGTSAGTVEVLGGPPDRTRRRRLGYVPQNLGLYRDLTLDENLTFVAGAYSAVKPAVPAELRSYTDVLVGDLPLGAARRVAFVAALCHAPEVLLLDEPTSALDPISTARIEELISELKADYTIAIVTHNMQQAARVSDKTAYMYLGELMEFGATDQIFLKPVRKETEDYITGRFG
jgi:ABC-2 type transport system ATP-binding protein/ribosome-dependent ATPase